MGVLDRTRRGHRTSLLLRIIWLVRCSIAQPSLHSHPRCWAAMNRDKRSQLLTEALAEEQPLALTNTSADAKAHIFGSDGMSGSAGVDS